MAWDIPLGTEMRRREVHERYKGSGQGGMTRAGGTDNLLLFSSDSGRLYGYDFDGWRPDGAFHYTGEGQVGDQRFIRNNAALRDHVARGLRLRLFREVRRSVVRYLGEFRLAPSDSYYPEESLGRDGALRKVIVFRLVPVDAETSPADAAASDPTGSGVRDVPVENHVKETFQTNPRREPTQSERREAQLVDRYIARLTAEGHSVIRKEITTAQLRRALYTDLYVTTTNELVEAKSSASRHHVRLAIGQLFDYARYVKPDSQAALFPSDPGSELTQLLHSVRIACVFEDEHGSFVRREPPTQSG